MEDTKGMRIVGRVSEKVKIKGEPITEAKDWYFIDWCTMVRLHGMPPLMLSLPALEDNTGGTANPIYLRKVDSELRRKREFADVIAHLNGTKYSKNKIIESLAEGERPENAKLYHALMKVHQPKYYIGGDNPIASFNLIKDFHLEEKDSEDLCSVTIENVDKRQLEKIRKIIEVGKKNNIKIQMI